MEYSTAAPELMIELQRYARQNNDVPAAEVFLDFIRRQPDCFCRTCEEGHITASAWVLNPAATHVLLTHHRRLGRWFQLGGHLEENDASVLQAALREAREESGLQEIRPVSEAILDLDRHLIPARPGEPAHFHYDIRYLLQATEDRPPIVSHESRDVRWIALAQVAQLNDSESILRMLRRTPEILSQMPR